MRTEKQVYGDDRYVQALALAALDAVKRAAMMHHATETARAQFIHVRKRLEAIVRYYEGVVE